MTIIYSTKHSGLKPLFLLFLTITILFSACSQEEVPPEDNEPVFLSDYVELTEIPTNTIKLFASFLGLGELTNQIRYDITLYKISYWSTYQGEPILASGLLAVPNGVNETFPLLSAHHGTIFSEEDAPSNFQLPNHVSGFEFLASLGYITLIPDYIGYGESQEVLHPYYDFQATATAITDFIQAGKEFLPEISVEENGQLFLLGYSEGGYATVATQKAIEENPGLNLKVTAAAAGAGGYDIENMVTQISKQETYPFPAYLALVVSGYNTTNQWNRPLTDFFNEPYANRLSTAFDGSNNGITINQQLNDTIQVLFAPDFLDGLNNKTETIFFDALQANNVHNWKPDSPLRLYHEQDDEIIPISDSENTFAQMKDNGATQVEYFPYDEADSHSAGFQPMLEHVIPWFESLKL